MVPQGTIESGEDAPEQWHARRAGWSPTSRPKALSDPLRARIVEAMVDAGVDEPSTSRSCRQVLGRLLDPPLHHMDLLLERDLIRPVERRACRDHRDSYVHRPTLAQARPTAVLGGHPRDRRRSSRRPADGLRPVSRGDRGPSNPRGRNRHPRMPGRSEVLPEGPRATARGPCREAARTAAGPDGDGRARRTRPTTTPRSGCPSAPSSPSIPSIQAPDTGDALEPADPAVPTAPPPTQRAH